MAVLLGVLGVDDAVAGPFLPGEILLSNYNGSNVQRYGADGSLLQTYTGTGTLWEGAALMPDGKLVTGRRSPDAGINIFNAAGLQVGLFNASGAIPGDVSVFAGGKIALATQNFDTIQLYSEAGSLLGSTSMPGLDSPFGTTVGTDNILYVAGFNTNNLARVNEAGTFLGLINLGFKPGDLVMSPLDGTLWVSNFTANTVHHLTTAGVSLGSFSTGLAGGFDGIGIAPDGNSLYVTTETSTVIRELSLTGSLIRDIPIVSPSTPIFLTVVPAPEPSSALLLAGAGLGLMGFRRRRR